MSDRLSNSINLQDVSAEQISRAAALCSDIPLAQNAIEAAVGIGENGQWDEALEWFQIGMSSEGHGADESGRLLFDTVSSLYQRLQILLGERGIHDEGVQILQTAARRLELVWSQQRQRGRVQRRRGTVTETVGPDLLYAMGRRWRLGCLREHHRVLVNVLGLSREQLMILQIGDRYCDEGRQQWQVVLSGNGIDVSDLGAVLDRVDAVIRQNEARLKLLLDPGSRWPENTSLIVGRLGLILSSMRSAIGATQVTLSDASRQTVPDSGEIKAAADKPMIQRASSESPLEGREPYCIKKQNGRSFWDREEGLELTPERVTRRVREFLGEYLAQKMGADAEIVYRVMQELPSTASRDIVEAAVDTICDSLGPEGSDYREWIVFAMDVRTIMLSCREDYVEIREKLLTAEYLVGYGFELYMHEMLLAFLDHSGLHDWNIKYSNSEQDTDEGSDLVVEAEQRGYELEVCRLDISTSGYGKSLNGRRSRAAFVRRENHAIPRLVLSVFGSDHSMRTEGVMDWLRIIKLRGSNGMAGLGEQRLDPFELIVDFLQQYEPVEEDATDRAAHVWQRMDHFWEQQGIAEQESRNALFDELQRILTQQILHAQDGPRALRWEHVGVPIQRLLQRFFRIQIRQKELKPVGFSS